MKMVATMSDHVGSYNNMVVGSNQGTGKLGLMNYKTDTIVDTTKMSPEEKAAYIQQYNNNKKPA